jgi:hypothetical protein
MRILAILFFISQSLYCFSQNEWAEIGTKWWYEQVQIQPPYMTSYNLIEVEKDTVINNKTVKKLDWKIASGLHQYPQLYTYEEFGKVYFIYENDSVEYLTYDFSAGMGDTVMIFTPHVFGSGVDSFRVRIDSIVPVNFNGIIKNVHFNSKIYPSDYDFGNWIYPIGSDLYFLPQYGGLDPPTTGPIRCYESVTDGLINFTGYSCDTIALKIKELNSDLYKLNIYPNPATSFTTIDWKLPVENSTLTIIDLTGRKIAEVQIQNREGSWLWDTRSLPNGIYLYEIRTVTERIASGNIAVQH